MIARRPFLSAGLAAALSVPRARAQSKLLRIGCLTEMTGPLAETAGTGSVACARMAIDESGLADSGVTIDLLVGDHQNKPDVGAGIAQQWFDQEGVDMIVDVPNSAVALSVASVARTKNKVYLNAGAGVADLTGPQCAPTTIHWTYDTWMLANVTAQAVTRSGAKTWYFIAVDYAFGHAMVRDATKFVESSGGKVLGATFYPFPGTTDFSSFLVQAQSTGAQAIAFANAGADLINSLKQSVEFGVNKGNARIVALLAFIQDIHSAGLPVARGVALSSTFYWDQNDRTRAFTRRLLQRPNGVYAAMGQAGTYSATLHYLKTVAQMGVAQAKLSGADTVARMKQIPTDDDAFGPGYIRQDGRKIHPAYLYQVKSPAESASDWDIWKLVDTIPAEQAFRPMSEGGCPMIKT